MKKVPLKGAGSGRGDSTAGEAFGFSVERPPSSQELQELVGFVQLFSGIDHLCAVLAGGHPSGLQAPRPPPPH